MDDAHSACPETAFVDQSLGSAKPLARHDAPALRTAAQRTDLPESNRLIPEDAGSSIRPILMRLGLLFLSFFAVASTACGGDIASTRLVLRVDQTLDRASVSVRSPTNAIPDASFKPQQPEDRYELIVSGDHVSVVPLAGPPPSAGTMEGTRAASPAGETRFDLQSGTFAGGRLVIRGDRGELTIFGSGVPIVSSERGSLVVR